MLANPFSLSFLVTYNLSIIIIIIITIIIIIIILPVWEFFTQAFANGLPMEF